MKPTKLKKETVSATVPLSLVAKIEALAEAQDRSKSYIVGKILEDWAAGKPMDFGVNEPESPRYLADSVKTSKAPTVKR